MGFSAAEIKGHAVRPPARSIDPNYAPWRRSPLPNLVVFALDEVLIGDQLKALGKATNERARTRTDNRRELWSGLALGCLYEVPALEHFPTPGSKEACRSFGPGHRRPEQCSARRSLHSSTVAGCQSRMEKTQRPSPLRMHTARCRDRCPSALPAQKLHSP